MPRLVVPDVWRTQPPYITRVNRSHWLARGLKCAYNPAAGPVNLVTGKPASSITTLPPLIYRDGLAFCREGALAFDVIVPVPLTIHTVEVFDGSGTSDRICGVNGSGSGWRYETNSNTLLFTFGGVNNYSSGAFLTDALDYDKKVIGVTTVATAVTGGDLRFFGNGKLISNTAPGTYIASNTNFDCGDATCALILLYDRALSDGEVVALSANPWQLFETTAAIFFPASGGSSFHPAWAVNATQTIQSRLAA